MNVHEITGYLDECRQLVLRELPAIMPRSPRYRAVLYDLMLEYPLRGGKALRPALCIAACRALGGRLESVLLSAAVLELYHNAFLIHDDVEDGSEQRRGEATLHRAHGLSIAVNVGDAMLALTLEPLLDNIEVLGLGKALRILRTVARMARESAEGQALELDWIRQGRWDLVDGDYIRMVYKKTGWYTFIAPLVVGGIAAGASAPQLRGLRNFGAVLSIAFQIQDDVLNLTADDRYGKEAAGDLWEGKRTLILLHALRTGPPDERARAIATLMRARPTVADRPTTLTRQPAPITRPRIHPSTRAPKEDSIKSERDVMELHALIERQRSIPYATMVASRWAARAQVLLSRTEPWMERSVHRDLLEGLVRFVVTRES